MEGWRESGGNQRSALRRDEDAEAARLVARVQAGDRAAFGEIYRHYFDRVYGYLHILLRNRHEAEDATQQVFLKAFEALSSYEQRRSFWVWLFIVVRNQAMDELRKRGKIEPEDPAAIDRHRERRAQNGDGQEDLPVLDWIRDRDLILFIERLPVPQRQVLLLRYMLGLSNPEIGDILDRTPADVSKLHHRALAFLRHRLTAVGRDSGKSKPTHWRRHPKKAQVIRARRYALLRHSG